MIYLDFEEGLSRTLMIPGESYHVSLTASLVAGLISNKTTG